MGPSSIHDGTDRDFSGRGERHVEKGYPAWRVPLRGKGGADADAHCRRACGDGAGIAGDGRVGVSG